MDDKKIKKLASDIMLLPNKEVITLTKKMLNEINEELKELENFNLDNVLPIAQINEKPIDLSLIRDDIVDDSFRLSKEAILKNSSHSNNDYVIVKKVV
ncbi:Asp-tRNA(Asn)/Glu-tRNA(Gln) amidotransferase subunit GatC [Metamycoplasma buccale]|uniref:Asp-tRNA(Asn)/Glu-tRNA(Gln) amidotransferase subunit GatC n=1 Tax=Metamycoplasma buccale TaxID=55602 RepID=UPI00398F18A8